VTLAQYKTGLGLPPQLFSHSDQQVQWQSSVPDKPFTTGWGGRLADLVNAMNQNTQLSMSVSLSGINSFQVGNKVTQYTLSSNGAVQISGNGTTGNNGVRYQAQKDLLNIQQSNLFEAAFGGVTSNAINDAERLQALTNNPLFPVPNGAQNTKFKTVFPNTTSGNQLRMIANLIGAANDPTYSVLYGVKRQVFFSSLGGWDLHAGQVNQQDPTKGNHANLLGTISDAVTAFYNATVEMGVANQVTTFTASDFSRTFTTNGDGSDHGWGSNHMIVGGAVQGGDIYGQMASQIIGGTSPDDTGRGRWIPSTSVDEYSATLATWFGVSPTDLATVLPNIGRFAHPNLGFMG